MLCSLNTKRKIAFHHDRSSETMRLMPSCHLFSGPTISEQVHFCSDVMFGIEGGLLKLGTNKAEAKMHLRFRKRIVGVNFTEEFSQKF